MGHISVMRIIKQQKARIYNIPNMQNISFIT